MIGLEEASIAMVIGGAIAIVVGVLMCPDIYHSDCSQTISVTTTYYW